MRRLELPFILALAACGSAATARAPALAPAPAVSASLPAPPVSVAEAPPAAPPPVAAGWKSVPKEHDGLWVAVDGLCSKLTVSSAGADRIVSYGGIARMFEPKERTGTASFIAIRDGKWLPIDTPEIDAPMDIDGRSADDLWIGNSQGSRSGFPSTMLRRQGGTWHVLDGYHENAHPWVDGGIIGEYGGGPLDVWVDGTKTAPPPAFSDRFVSSDIAAFPDSVSVVSVGQAEESPAKPGLSARHWSKAAGLKVRSLASIFGFKEVWPVVRVVGPNEIYVGGDDKVARWDGETWSLFATAKKEIKTMSPYAPGQLWAVLKDESLARVTAKGFEPVATPEPVAYFSVTAEPWIAGKSGKLYKRSGETWREVKLPAPAFTSGEPQVKVQNLRTFGPDDVFIVADYYEKTAGWTEPEPRRVVYRTKPVDETLRCNEPDPQNNYIYIGKGFQSWPPMATAECTTPFAILARRSHGAEKAKNEWPKIRAALKGHSELKLVEFTSGDRVFVGAAVKDLAAGKEIATLVGAKDRLRPEIVCGAPENPRELAPLD